VVIGSDLHGCGSTPSDTISTLCGDEGRGNTISMMRDDDEGTPSTGGNGGLTAGMVLGSSSSDLRAFAKIVHGSNQWIRMARAEATRRSSAHFASLGSSLLARLWPSAQIERPL
jgi:hypothetical protein